MTSVLSRSADRGVATRRPRDLRRLDRWFAAVLMPIGPAAVAILRFRLPYSDTDSAAGSVVKIAANPGAERLVLWLLVVAFLTLVPGAIAATRLAARSAPVLAAVAAVLLIPGYLALPAVSVLDFIGITATKPGVDVSAVARVAELANSQPTVSLLSTVFVAGHLIGTVLLAVALWRGHLVPVVGAAILGLSQPVHLAAAITGDHPLDLLGWGMTAVGMTFVAVRLIRTPDDDWAPAPAPLPVRR